MLLSGIVNLNRSNGLLIIKFLSVKAIVFKLNSHKKQEVEKNTKTPRTIHKITIPVV